MVGEVQVEQEEHVEGSQGATDDKPRGLAHGPGQQHRHLVEGRGSMLNLYIVWYKGYDTDYILIYLCNNPFITASTFLNFLYCDRHILFVCNLISFHF